MNSSVTVGIPFYSDSKPEELKAAIDSIISQSLRSVDIHLIQDGLVPEALSQIIHSYIEGHSNITHLVIKHNSGLAHAINLSILNTTSKYYARMDSDDIAHPQRLEKQVQFLETHPDIDILGTWAVEFENDPEQGSIRKLPVEATEMKQMFHYRNPFIHPTVVFRRSVFAKIGLYDATFLDEDLELWSRAFLAGINVANLPEPLLFYRFAGSIQRRSSRLYYHIKARYQFNTWSIKLNLLKVLSLLLRIMPYPFQAWAYKNLRS
jgi:glycosyltransferase involved in cell wall biosynthesis